MQSPRPTPTLCLTLLFTSVLTVSAMGASPRPRLFGPPQGTGFDPRDAGRMLVRSADRDGDGNVSAAEQEAFLSRHAAPESAAALAPDTFLALALGGFYDDGDGTLNAKDLEVLWARWDGDGDGAVSVSERLNGPRGRWLLDGVVLKALDADRDGAVDATERRAARDFDLVTWLGAVADIPEDINGFGPGTMVLTLRASLDIDTDGTFDGEDLNLLFAQLDADGNGAIDAGELIPPAAPTSSDWSVSSADKERSPAIAWQRSLDDALALSRSTGKPLLICVNTDGEAASENLAYGRYRDPDFARLTEGFIPILASPNRHTEREVDTRGRRIECTRFGRLLCSEHIDHEPLLFERYFNDQRIAPRHVGVAPDGTILFDLVLLRDLGRIDQALREFGNFETRLPDPTALATDQLLDSPDAGARAVLAQRYLAATSEERLRLVALALSPTRATQHPQLLAMGLYDSDPHVRTVAALRMTEHMGEPFVDYAPRLRWVAGSDKPQRELLIEALAALAERTTDATKRVRARRLTRVFRALELPAALDVRHWRIALMGAPQVQVVSAAEEGAELEAALAELDSELRSNRHDPDLNALLAQTSLRLALRAIRGEGGGNAQFFLQDAESAALRVLSMRPDDLLAGTVLARAQWWLNRPTEAADLAARLLPRLAPVADAPLAGEMLDILGQGRTRRLYPALGTDEGWPANWVPQAVGAYTILSVHPSCTEAQALAGVSLLENLEDYRGQARLIRSCLRHFPGSADLHSWLRWQVLRDGDEEHASAAALTHAYRDLPLPTGWEATWTWFEALAKFTAGQTLATQGDLEAARGAYTAAIADFEHSVTLQPDFAESTQTYVDQARSALLSL